MSDSSLAFASCGKVITTPVFHPEAGAIFGSVSARAVNSYLAEYTVATLL
jgi:hypothetical protein